MLMANGAMGRMSQTQEQQGIGQRCAKMLDGMSQGTAFKFSFLIGIFLANGIRSIVLICDFLSHTLGDVEVDAHNTKTSSTLAITGLPTLFLMTAFTIFIYYFAQVTV